MLILCCGVVLGDAVELVVSGIVGEGEAHEIAIQGLVSTKPEFTHSPQLELSTLKRYHNVTFFKPEGPYQYYTIYHKGDVFFQ